MKRFWKIVTSRHPSHELLCWAADSKIGVICVVVFWILAHVAFGCYAITGKGWFNRSYDAALYWIDLSLFGAALLAVDAFVLSGIWRGRKTDRVR